MSDHYLRIIEDARHPGQRRYGRRAPAQLDRMTGRNWGELRGELP